MVIFGHFLVIFGHFPEATKSDISKSSRNGPNHIYWPFNDQKWRYKGPYATLKSIWVFSGAAGGLSAPQDLNFWDWSNSVKIIKKPRYCTYRFLISFENYPKMPKIDSNGAQTHSEHQFLQLEGHMRWFWAFLGDFEIFDFVASGKWPKMAKKWSKMVILARFCHLNLDTLRTYPRKTLFW